jgi:hypothetical protein
VPESGDWSRVCLEDIIAVLDRCAKVNVHPLLLFRGILWARLSEQASLLPLVFRRSVCLLAWEREIRWAPVLSCFCPKMAQALCYPRNPASNDEGVCSCAVAAS